MGRTYRATGINLKGMALGESDRLLTILTKEHGLIRAVASGARKHRSLMAGRAGLFVVNDLQISSGRSLDRITQAETLNSFVGLGANLGKLTAAQYLAEIALLQALSEQPQEELFLLLTEHLLRLQSINHTENILAYLNHGIYHLLAIAGLAPQVHSCCMTRQLIVPDSSDSKWQVGFSIIGGGLVALVPESNNPINTTSNLTKSVKINYYLNAKELDALQKLTQVDLCLESLIYQTSWRAIERILRAYVQYHFDQPIQSAALIDSCFNF